jgi:hypothetical protein
LSLTAGLRTAALVDASFWLSDENELPRQSLIRNRPDYLRKSLKVLRDYLNHLSTQGVFEQTQIGKAASDSASGRNGMAKNLAWS